MVRWTWRNSLQQSTKNIRLPRKLLTVRRTSRTDCSRQLRTRFTSLHTKQRTSIWFSITTRARHGTQSRNPSQHCSMSTTEEAWTPLCSRNCARHADLLTARSQCMELPDTRTTPSMPIHTSYRRTTRWWTASTRSTASWTRCLNRIKHLNWQSRPSWNVLRHRVPPSSASSTHISMLKTSA